MRPDTSSTDPDTTTTTTPHGNPPWLLIFPPHHHPTPPPSSIHPPPTDRPHHPPLILAPSSLLVRSASAPPDYVPPASLGRHRRRREGPEDRSSFPEVVETGGGGGRRRRGKECSERCMRCVVVVTTLRWLLVSVALLGAACVVAGIVFGVISSTLDKSTFFVLSFTFIGLGIVLVIVVCIGWRCAPAGHEPCHSLFRLGRTSSDFGFNPYEGTAPRGASQLMHRGRNQWYGGFLYPEFRYGTPPPSYATSMEQYCQRLQRRTDDASSGVFGNSTLTSLGNASSLLPGGTTAAVNTPPPSYHSRVVPRIRPSIGGLVELPPPYRSGSRRTSEAEEGAVVVVVENANGRGETVVVDGDSTNYSADSSTEPSTNYSADSSTNYSTNYSADSSTEPSTYPSTESSTNYSTNYSADSSTNFSTNSSTNSSADSSTTAAVELFSVPIIDGSRSQVEDTVVETANGNPPASVPLDIPPSLPTSDDTPLSVRSSVRREAPTVRSMVRSFEDLSRKTGIRPKIRGNSTNCDRSQSEDVPERFDCSAMVHRFENVNNDDYNRNKSETTAGFQANITGQPVSCHKNVSTVKKKEISDTDATINPEGASTSPDLCFLGVQDPRGDFEDDTIRFVGGSQTNRGLNFSFVESSVDSSSGDKQRFCRVLSRGQSLEDPEIGESGI